MSVYIKAAQAVHAGKSESCCWAIAEATAGYIDEKRLDEYPEANRFGALFQPVPRKENAWWGDYFSDNERDRRECRVLALCFMAAIAGESA